jgi:uncharacterized OsmC-like protein
VGIGDAIGDAIRDAIEKASAYLTQHPDEAVYTDSVATATLEERLHVRVVGPGGEVIETDMPTSVGGRASAPSSGWFLRAAEAACVATLVAMRAAQLGISLSDLEVSVDSVSDDRGILGLDPAIAAGPLRGRVAIRLSADGATAEDLDTLAHWAVDHCPVVDAVRRSVPIDVQVEISKR